jgi:fatty acid desaturase
MATVAEPARNWLGYGPPPADMPIPDRINLAVVVTVVTTATGLLWAGSHVETWYSVIGVGVVFSYVLLTDYALLHESAHGNLQSSPWRNYVCGLVTGLLFPAPFTMIRTTHKGHHLRNRTDFEMFDLYYPSDSRAIKFIQWYGVLCGLFWPFVPIAAVLFALCPGVLRTWVFREYRPYRYLLGDIRNREVRAIRGELVLTIAFFAALFWLLELRWQNTLALYACFALNWSTRQYVGHAYSKRDVIEGAWNLRHNRLMSCILLHGELDLNHHRRPDVPWYYLPCLSPATEPRRSYVAQYWRQWLGPRPVTEPAPESLCQMPLSVHQ